jgi:hypothetical protein
MWTRVFAALEEHCHRSSLKSIIFRESIQRSHDINYTSQIYTIDIIQPLLSFPNITYVGFPFQRVYFDDSAARDIAVAWPNIQVLNFQEPFSKRPPRSQLTLQGLIPFAEYYKELRYFCVTIDASSTPSD